MKSPIRRFSYSDQEQRFAAACEWLSSLNVRIDANRVAMYANDLRRIRKSHDAGNIDYLVDEQGFPKLMNSLVEATEIIDLHEGLRHVNDPAIAARLRDYACGVAMNSDEQPQGNRPRSVGFELAIAAMLAEAGIDRADVWASVPNWRIAFECKRPMSPSKIDTRIREGLDQLSALYRSGDGDNAVYSILALSISKVENDGTRALKAADAAEIGRHVNEIMDAFAQHHEASWMNRISRQTLAILLYLRTPCFVENPNLLTVVTHTVWICFHTDGSRERNAFNAVANPISTLIGRKRGELTS